jgi:hypothetical protein
MSMKMLRSHLSPNALIERIFLHRSHRSVLKNVLVAIYANQQQCGGNRRLSSFALKCPFPWWKTRCKVGSIL